MIALEDGMLLYHASYAEIRNIDLAKGRGGLDFGKGFYLTSSYDQAKRYVPQAVRKAKLLRRIPASFQLADAVINTYRVHLDAALFVYCFETANIDWLHFVSANREHSLFPEILNRLHRADVVGGKIANDNTARTLALYTEGAYGTPGELEADQYVLRLLLPNRLQDQFCFRTAQAIACLEFMRGERYGISGAE